MAERLLPLGRIAREAWRHKRKSGWLKVGRHLVLKSPSFVAVHGREHGFERGYRRHTIAVFPRVEHVRETTRAHASVDFYGPSVRNIGAVGTVCLDEYEPGMLSPGVSHVLNVSRELEQRHGVWDAPMNCYSQAHYRVEGRKVECGLPKWVHAKLAEWRLQGFRTALRIARDANQPVLVSKLERNNAHVDFKRACKMEGASVLEGRRYILAFPRGVDAPPEAPREKSGPLWHLD